MLEEKAQHVPPIESERLSLVWMSPTFMQASLDGRVPDAERAIGAKLPFGWPDGETRRRLEMRLEQMLKEPEFGQWLLRTMVERASGQVIGIINFHGPPDQNGRAELGYTVFEPHRRRGYASEAAGAMMSWARAEPGVHVFVLSISPQNEPSLAMAAKLGFSQVGTQIDEVDGLEWIFELSR